MSIPKMLADLREKAELTQSELADILGTSFVSISRWERGASTPSPAQAEQIKTLLEYIDSNPSAELVSKAKNGVFASHGIRDNNNDYLPLFDGLPPTITLGSEFSPPIIDRITDDMFFSPKGKSLLAEMISQHRGPASTTDTPPSSGMSAGKNTYTYDAHTYHTKVPPQGIAEILKHYLPEGGLVLDLFAGSGMTGVAGRTCGYDVILNELSPAACFIANRFTSHIDPRLFAAGIDTILQELDELRKTLYTTTCRECGKNTELIYTVWSYNVVCNHCNKEFLLWDHARHYGKTVREHKILSKFDCPHCGVEVKKSRLDRTSSEPVMVVYKCCDGYQHHPLNESDWKRVREIGSNPPVAKDFFPTNELSQGVNLRQPIKHGLATIDSFYTPRNLAALSNIWAAIHRIQDLDLAAFIAFAFTSLYQRVTRLSEFRFWGGSGNLARFNVPFVSKEANVFDTFARKARSIQDHLEATASNYHGRALVVQHSATSLDYLPDNSIDLIFTDPPFGANINYSEVNILWESWLGDFTDSTEEAIINKVQGKDVTDYEKLMHKSLAEAYRVLRPGHWLLLMFMNSSQEVWEAIHRAILDAGFEIKNIDIFDKQHATFKQLVSDNTAGADLVIHCLKPIIPNGSQSKINWGDSQETLHRFLESVDLDTYRNTYLHVTREDEFDFRRLYSEWLSVAIQNKIEALDFAAFREIVIDWLNS